MLEVEDDGIGMDVEREGGLSLAASGAGGAEGRGLECATCGSAWR